MVAFHDDSKSKEKVTGPKLLPNFEKITKIPTRLNLIGYITKKDQHERRMDYKYGLHTVTATHLDGKLVTFLKREDEDDKWFARFEEKHTIRFDYETFKSKHIRGVRLAYYLLKSSS